VRGRRKTAEGITKKEEGIRQKEEGRAKRVPHVRAILPLLILLGGSSSVRTALLSQQSFRGWQLSATTSLSLFHTRTHIYIRDLGSATMCDSNEQIRSNTSL
jgi:hypothetical protein